MGFLAGFAESVHDNLKEQRRIKANREDQMFSAKFNAYMKRQDQMAQYEREAAKNVRKAKALTEGYPIPQDAWTEVYRWVRDGVDDSTIEKRLKSGRFVSTDSTPENPSMANIESQTDDAMQEGAQLRPENVGGVPASPEMPEMAGQSPMHEPAEGAFPEAPPAPSAGMAPAATPAAGAPMPEMEESPMARRTNQRIAEAAGVSQDEVSRTLSGGGLGREPDIPQSKLKFLPGIEAEWPGGVAEIKWRYDQAVARDDVVAAKNYADMLQAHDYALKRDQFAKNPMGLQEVIIVGPGGKPTTALAVQGPDGWVDAVTKQPIPEENFIRNTMEEERKIWSELDAKMPEIEKQRTKMTQLNGAYLGVADLIESLEKSPELLLITARGAQAVSGTVREVEGLIKILRESPPGSEQAQAAATRLQNLDNTVSAKLKQTGIGRTAEARDVWDAKAKILAYRLGDIEGVGDRTSNKENQRLDSIINSSTDPEVVKKILASYMSDLKATLNTGSEGINQYNNVIGMLKKRFQYSPLEELAPTADQFLSDAASANPKLKSAIDKVNKYAGQEVGQAPTQQAPKPEARNIPERAMEALRQNPELRGEFDAKYGEGSANRVLGGQ